jgi:hypothetical protein
MVEIGHIRLNGLSIHSHFIGYSNEALQAPIPIAAVWLVEGWTLTGHSVVRHGKTLKTWSKFNPFCAIPRILLKPVTDSWWFVQHRNNLTFIYLAHLAQARGFRGWSGIYVTKILVRYFDTQ